MSKNAQGRQKVKKAGKRHVLMLYRRTMDSLWQATLVLGLLLAAIWKFGYYFFPAIEPPYDTIIFIGALVVLAFTLFAVLARNGAYVQAYHDHLRLVTPFLRLKISYRRVRTVRSVEFQSEFPRKEMSWAQREVLEPFFGATLLVVEVLEYPLSKGLLRLFLPEQAFSNKATGFVLLVKDWMGLSTEIDSFLGTFKQKQAERFLDRYTTIG